MAKKIDNVVRPDHYKTSGKEVYQMMIDVWGKEKFIAFCEMNAFKYRMRMGKKNPIEEDLAKAEWYEKIAMEMLQE